MRRICGGAVAVVAGIVVLIEAYSHSPGALPKFPAGFEGPNVVTVAYGPSSGWSQTAYDLARMWGWALIVLGAVTLVVLLIGYRRSAPANPS